MLPFDHNLPMAMQAESRMGFRLLNGYSQLLSGFNAGTEAARHLSRLDLAFLNRLRSPSLPHRYWHGFGRFLRAQGVTAILVYEKLTRSWQAFLSRVPASMERVGGVTLYRLRWPRGSVSTRR